MNFAFAYDILMSRDAKRNLFFADTVGSIIFIGTG